MPLDNNQDASVITEITNLVRGQAQVLQVFDKKLVVINGEAEVFENPVAPSPLHFSTLQGIVDYASLVKEDSEEHLVAHVASENLVTLMRPIVGDGRQQFTYAAATPILPRVVLSQFLDMEAFLIQLLSGFEDKYDRLHLQKQIGTLKPGLLTEIEDDGVSQTVSAKAGLTRAATGKVVNRFDLSRFCTFPEIAQPVVPYILRIKQVKSGDEISATAALFEADGGAWRVGAIAAIGAWLREKLGDEVTVLA